MQDAIEPTLQRGDLRRAMASLGFQPHSRKKIKRGALEEEEKKNHSTLKTNLLRDPAAAAAAAA